MRKMLPFVFLCLPCLAYGQAPSRAGAEFRVNTYTTGVQAVSGASADAAGRFVVVWSTYDGASWGVAGQRFDADGEPLGPEFPLNTYTTFGQYSPSVASAPGGAFLVAWTGQEQDGSGLGVFARAYDAAGTPRGPEFLVNGSTSGDQDTQHVAAIPGGFIVVWENHPPGDMEQSVWGRLYRENGEVVSPEFRLSAATTPFLRYPVASALPNGAYVVAWVDRSSEEAHDHVFVRRFDTSGPLGPETQVDTTTLSTDYVRRSSLEIATRADGGFIVTWTLSGCTVIGIPPTSIFCIWPGVQAREYDANGAPVGAEFNVPEAPRSITDFATQASTPAGVHTAAWTTRGGQLCSPACLPDWVSQDGSGMGIYARRFGSTSGPEFQVNTYTTGSQYDPVVASDPAGNVLIAWTSVVPGGGTDVFAQRFGGLRPAGLDVDTAGNHLLEPGETVDVRPAWRNVTGGAQAFSAALTSLTGPAGATYTITDGSADYGTAANGATTSCADCFAVSVSDPTVRPVTHWDATALETIVPASQGQQQPWRLHVGRSFTDVTAASPFYRFVETLLHRGITAGCTATTYCPSQSTTREQMAVFVLVAKEGAGYTPPACVPPNLFNDVPETSPFCRYIEELANRGVVGGCAANQYCGSAPVTREQMAVFVLRTLDPTLDPPACAAPNMFTDVPETSPFCRWVEELARRGIVAGCGDGKYCGGAAVTREQMGVFLGVTFGLTLYGV